MGQITHRAPSKNIKRLKASIGIFMIWQRQDITYDGFQTTWNSIVNRVKSGQLQKYKHSLIPF